MGANSISKNGVGAEAMISGTNGSALLAWLVASLCEPGCKYRDWSSDAGFKPSHCQTWPLQADRTRKCGSARDCRFSAIGLSMYPLKGKDTAENLVMWDGLDHTLATLGAHLPQLRLIVLARTNLVKLALAQNGDHSGLKMSEPANKSKPSDRPSPPPPPTQLKDWAPSSFAADVNHQIRREAAMRAFVSQLAPDVRRRILTVQYEALQLDLVAEMLRVCGHLGLRGCPPAGAPRTVYETAVHKGSPEDLRDLLSNFAELEAMLAPGGSHPSECLRSMLLAPGPQRFDVLCNELAGPWASSDLRQEPASEA